MSSEFFSLHHFKTFQLIWYGMPPGYKPLILTHSTVFNKIDTWNSGLDKKKAFSWSWIALLKCSGARLISPHTSPIFQLHFHHTKSQYIPFSFNLYFTVSLASISLVQSLLGPALSHTMKPYETKFSSKCYLHWLHSRISISELVFILFKHIGSVFWPCSKLAHEDILDNSVSSLNYHQSSLNNVPGSIQPPLRPVQVTDAQLTASDHSSTEHGLAVYAHMYDTEVPW